MAPKIIAIQDPTPIEKLIQLLDLHDRNGNNTHDSRRKHVSSRQDGLSGRWMFIHSSRRPVPAPRHVWICNPSSAAGPGGEEGQHQGAVSSVQRDSQGNAKRDSNGPRRRGGEELERESEQGLRIECTKGLDWERRFRLDHQARPH